MGYGQHGEESAGTTKEVKNGHLLEEGTMEAQLWGVRAGLPFPPCPRYSLSILSSFSSKPHHKSISYLVKKGTSTESSREIPLSTLPRK